MVKIEEYFCFGFERQVHFFLKGDSSPTSPLDMINVNDAEDEEYNAHDHPKQARAYGLKKNSHWFFISEFMVMFWNSGVLM